MNLNRRFWEIDFLRGLAVILMIAYHFLFDINFFGIYSFNMSTGILWFFPRVIAATFIFLVGISLYLSYTRAEIKGIYLREPDFFFKYLKRGVWIFSLGIIITLATWIFIREDFIIFGILHFIGLAIIIQYPFLKYNKRYKYLNLVMGLVFIIIGLYITSVSYDFFYMLWLGFVPQNMSTVDYFPLLPWLGVVSLGLFTGGLLYRDYRRRYRLPDFSAFLPIKVFTYLGRHSLIIYFIHQPLLIALLYYMGVLNPSYFF